MFNLKKPNKDLISLFEKEIIKGDLNLIYNNFINLYDFDSNCKRKVLRDEITGFQRLPILNISEQYKEYIRDLKGLIGIDLPILHENKNLKNNKILMILAQDPLRNSKDFLHSENAIIGTPYALHSKCYRKKHKNSYNLIVEELLKDFEYVYLTDVVKVWAEASNLTKNKSVINNSINVLKNEINIVAPITILAMGKLAEKTINSLKVNSQIKIVNTPHPSARTKYWKGWLEDNKITRTNRKLKDEEISGFIIDKVKIN